MHGRTTTDWTTPKPSPEHHHWATAVSPLSVAATSPYHEIMGGEEMTVAKLEWISGINGLLYMTNNGGLLV